MGLQNIFFSQSMLAFNAEGLRSVLLLLRIAFRVFAIVSYIWEVFLNHEPK